MNKLGDIELFVSIVQNKGLGAGAKKLGLSPASATSRMNNLESNYGVRLLTRTTRKVSLTEEGRTFYAHCLKILQEVRAAEDHIKSSRGELSGNIKLTSTVDLGKSVIAPLVADFANAHPAVAVELTLLDHVVNLVDEGFDLAIRYGDLPDSRMIARKLATNTRLLFAAPEYIREHGEPKTPDELLKHRCLGLSRADQSLNSWYFYREGTQLVHSIDPVLSSNDGSQIRQWAIDGHGIALKSYWDVKEDLEAKRLVPLLPEYQVNYWHDGHNSADLYAVYPSKEYVPDRVRALLELLIQRFSKD